MYQISLKEVRRAYYQGNRTFPYNRCVVMRADLPSPVALKQRTSSPIIILAVHSGTELDRMVKKGLRGTGDRIELDSSMPSMEQHLYSKGQWDRGHYSRVYYKV